MAEKIRMDWYKNYIDISNKLLNHMHSENETDNVVCSPFSLYMLLGIALNATSGKTGEELLSALADGLSVEELTAAMAAMRTDFTGAMSGKDCKLKSSNAICVKEDLYDDIHESFQKLVEDVFRAEIFKAGSDMVPRVNAWVKEKTDGMIPRLIEQDMPGARAVLMNAIAFDAKWETKYEADDICEDGEFTNVDGSKSKATMLDSNESEYIEDEYYKGFVKNYKGGRYALMALLPRKKKNSFFDKALEHIDFKAYYDGRRRERVHATMPEFKIETSAELTALCRNLGIESIFTNQSDFSNLTDKEPLKVDSILQKAFISVDRSGTKAAATTAMLLVAGCIPMLEEIKEVVLNRPFVYAIVNRENGLPVLTGVVNRL